MEMKGIVSVESDRIVNRSVPKCKEGFVLRFTVTGSSG